MSVYHEILEIPENATVEQIRKAYRLLARRYHPDLNPAPDAQEQFIKVREAYEILMGERQAPSQKKYSPYSSGDNRTNEARERAKAYAKMRYEDFRRQSEAYESTPMHRILWPKWVNFVILIFCLLFIIDNILPVSQTTGIAHQHNSTRFEVNNLTFAPAIEQRNSNLEGVTVTVYYSPIIGYVKYYNRHGDFIGNLTPSFTESDYIPIVYFLLILTIMTLRDKTRKFENKLLIKTGMCILLVSYLFIYFAHF